MSVFDHPAFDGVDKRFLMSMQRQLTGAKNGAQMAQALLSIQSEAKKYNVQLTPERQQLLIVHLRNSLPPDKRAAFENFIRMVYNQ